MKLINPILITLNNTLHIKADNLEPVEVDSSCTSELERIISKYYRSRQGFRYSAMVRDLFEGLPISELSDRIEVREERILLAKSGGYKEGLMVEPATFIEGKPYKITHKAFLLPEKEDELSELLEIVDKKSYTIEEIEMAIRKENDNCGQPLTDKSIDEIINNLKK